MVAGVPKIVSVFRTSGADFVHLLLRVTSDGNMVGGSRHSLWLDPAWSSAEVKAAAEAEAARAGEPKGARHDARS